MTEPTYLYYDLRIVPPLFREGVTLEATNERDGYSAWMEVVEMMINFLSLVGSFPACRNTRNSGHIAACRISTMGQFDAFCLVNQQEDHPVLCG